MPKKPTTPALKESTRNKGAASKEKKAQKIEASVPFVLAGRSSVLRALVSGGSAGLTDPQRADVEARAQVVINLSDKIDGLIESEKKLTTAIDDEQVSEPDRASAKLRRREAIAERDLCRTRIDAINHSGPFSDPGSAEENKLLDAIDEVSRATATAAAIIGLLQAVHGLVQAYKAQSTT